MVSITSFKVLYITVMKMLLLPRLLQWKHFFFLAAGVLCAAMVDQQNPEPQVDIHLPATYNIFREGIISIYRQKGILF